MAEMMVAGEEDRHANLNSAIASIVMSHRAWDRRLMESCVGAMVDYVCAPAMVEAVHLNIKNDEAHL
ncbi:MAG TPA: hypothetical protein VK943_01430 [Arenibaculum sp.]|nr:hypothetical protein [Arenibaculum sp.]